MKLKKLIKENTLKHQILMSRINGIRAIISCEGIVETEGKISTKARERVNAIIEDGLENIAEGWAVEGECKDDLFYVYYIIDEFNKVLNVEDTIAWTSIMGYKMAPIKRTVDDKLKDFKDVHIRSAKEFALNERLSNALEILPSGREKRGGWRARVSDALSKVLPIDSKS